MSIMKKMTLARYHELSVSLFAHEPYDFLGDAYFAMLKLNDKELAEEFKASKYCPIKVHAANLEPFFRKLKLTWKE